MENYYLKGKNALDIERTDIALKYFQEGIASGDCKCEYGKIAVCAKNGEDITELSSAFSDILNTIIEQANCGDENSCFIVGRCYEMGIGTKPDLIKAIKYYETAAVKGNTDAMYNLGCIYMSVTKDEKQIIDKYFVPSANMGNLTAMISLAYYYEQRGDAILSGKWKTMAQKRILHLQEKL